MKKFLSLLLSMCILMSLAVPAMAANSDVLFESDLSHPDVFNVIVPDEIPVRMSSDGSISVSNTLAIQNLSDKAVEVQNIRVTGNSDWQVRDFDFDFDSLAADTHDLAMSFRGDGTDASGNIELHADWEIAKDASLPINADVRMPLQSGTEKIQIATVIWTIDWADGSGNLPENPGEDIKIQVLPGDHGAADVSEIQPGADGRVSEYPEVNANTGYDFKNWVNAESMNEVNTDTVYNTNTSIRPVFELKSGWTSVPVTPVPGVIIKPEKNPEVLIDPDGTVQVVPDITPDDGYTGGDLTDQDGNEIKPGTVINNTINITIIININKTDDNPSKYPMTVPVLPGDHGSSDADRIDTDENGKIPEFPTVTPDEGYLPDGWVDQDGKPVDTDTILNPGDTIKPVFKPDPDYKPDKTVTVPILPGDNGSCDKDSVTTDSDGKISEFPAVTPDEGYLPDGWVDQDGKPVDENTVFEPGDSIKPVFKPDPDYKPDKTVTVPILPGDNGSCDKDSVTTDSDGKIPEFPAVTPDEGYLPDGWVDQDGKPVDENTVFESGDSIKPVFKPDPDYKPDKTVIVTVLPGDHGMANTGSVTTDSDGKIPMYPSVNADEGYVFDHWENQNNEVVDENTVFNRGDSIRPVFAEITYQPFVITAENRSEIGYTGTTDENLVIPEKFQGSDGNYYTPVSINERAFNLCLNLKSVVIPNSVKTIGDYAFCRCDSLTSIDIGKSISTIGDGAFASSQNLKSIKIPNTTKTIGRSAFSGTGLTSLTIPNSVTSIGNMLCFNCDDLTSVKLSTSITAIPNDAFSGCYVLTDIVIPNNITSIGNGAFSSSGVTFTTVPSTIKTIGNSAFSNSKLTNFTVPDSVTSIGKYCFSSCKDLKTLTFSKNCPVIPECVCLGDPNLTSVTIPYGVREICDGAFQCTATAHGQNGSLKSITFPSSLRTIGNMIFYGQTISSLTVPSGVTSIASDAFNGVSKISYSGNASGGPYWGADRYT